MSNSDTLTALVEAAQAGRSIEQEVRRLREIEQWAHSTLNVHEGDAVTIRKGASIDTNNGWLSYREVLVPGCTGVVDQFWLSSRSGSWHGLFTPDVAWTVNDYPEPGTRRQKDHPHCFMVPLTWLRKRTEKDQPLTMPEDARATR